MKNGNNTSATYKVGQVQKDGSLVLDEKVFKTFEAAINRLTKLVEREELALAWGIGQEHEYRVVRA